MLLAAAAVLPAWSAPSKINLSSGVFPYSEEPKKALEAQVQELLASQDLRDKTWGAYLVGKHGFTNHIPALERILEPQPFGSSLERSLMLRAALDALIRLRARPDPETLLPTSKPFPTRCSFCFPEPRSGTRLSSPLCWIALYRMFGGWPSATCWRKSEHRDSRLVC